MTAEDGAQRGPLRPVRNQGGAAAPPLPDAEAGSSSKDRRWQQQGRRPAAGNGTSRLQHQSGRQNAPASAVEAAPASNAGHGSRIPHGGSAQQHQATPAVGGISRIPRPAQHQHLAALAPGASPHPDLVAMLATPVAAPLLEEMHAGGSWLAIDFEHQQQAAAAPQGFNSYCNPSFGARAQGAAAADSPAAATPAVDVTARVFVNSLADAEAEGAGPGELTPGLLDPAAITPNSERSLQAWLRGSPASAATTRPAGGARRQVQSVTPAGPDGMDSISKPAMTTDSKFSAMPTPEAWQMLQHINNESPAAAPWAAPGVRGIMNAYLRTGPQLLSPEPCGAALGTISAPEAHAVPATGILNVSGPGGMGVYGMMNAYIRTGANSLSPEPGMTPAMGAAVGTSAAAAQQQPMLHPYSPISPLAATPAPPKPAADGRGSNGRGGITPSSVCSNGNVDSCGPARSISLVAGVVAGPGDASVPRLNLGAVREQGQGDTSDTEVSFKLGLGQGDSPDQLPTARFGPVPGAGAGGAHAGQVQQQQQQAEEGMVACAAAPRHKPPSPILFHLPGDSAEKGAVPQPSQAPASDSPSFSFGFGFGGGAPAALAAAAGATAEQPADAGAAGAPVGAPEVVASAPAPGGVQAAEAAASMHRIDSRETVQQPHPFKAMLLHLRGPQYASPARFLRAAGAAEHRPDSPQSPKDCTPLHLISTSEALSPGAVVTPRPGQGSLTVWMDRRGMRAALSTPARNDLRLLWAAAHDLALYKSEASALRADNAALAEELEATQLELKAIGAEHEAAVVAAEAGALCAEAEVARARDAAAHMMQLADQIQSMFALCEKEKETLVQELEQAQQKLAESSAAAAAGATAADGDAADPTADDSEQQAALQQQLEEARQAVDVAQQAADAAQQRANDAAAELDAIRRQLEEAQEQLAAARAACNLTPVTKLRSQLGGVHESLAHLRAEHCAGKLACHPELERLLEASRGQLAHVEQLLGGDAAALRQENERLQRCLTQARLLLAESSPLATGAAQRAGLHEGRSPVLPFALFGRTSSEAELAGGGGEGFGEGASPGACSDVFSSPYMAASQATLTVDYRDLHSMQQEDSATSRGSPAFSSASAPASSGGASIRGESAGSPPHEEQQAGKGVIDGEEAGYTVVHNGMIITNVPASEVSKVKSMVQYWEAMANNTHSLVVATAEEADAAEAYAAAAIAAAEAAMAARQAAEEQEGELTCAPAAGVATEPAQQEASGEVELDHTAAGPAEDPATAEAVTQSKQAAADGATSVQASPVATKQPSVSADPSPVASPNAATPCRLASWLPAGDMATPCSQAPAIPVALASATGTPARFTPLGFVGPPPPTPASGIDPQQAQQLHHLAVSMAAVAAGGNVTPAGTPNNSSRVPATPIGTPLSSAVKVAVTPLALSALRARLAGSGGGAVAQDAVRSRLARLKADLQAAQAKLATVDQGLASIAFTPTSSITNSASMGSASTTQRRTPPSSIAAAPIGSPISAASGGSLQQEASFGSSSRAAAARIAAAGNSPLPPLPSPQFAAAAASPAAVSQRSSYAEAPAASPAAALPAEPQLEAEQAVGLAATEEQGTATMAAAAPVGVEECTPAPTRRSVRFADSVDVGSSKRGALRVGTPYSVAGSVAGAEAAAVTCSPVVGSCQRQRSPLGSRAAGNTPAANLPRSPLGAMQSAAKPGAGGGQAAMRQLALDQDDADSSASSDEDEELLFAASRMAQGRIPHPQQATPASAARLASPANTRTPMAHPEEAENDGGFARYHGAGGSRAALETPATSVLSAASLSPPEPLVLLAVRPMGRLQPRRGGLMRGGGGGGRPRSETEEKEFRRRAAALNIQISPYFRRRAA